MYTSSFTSVAWIVLVSHFSEDCSSLTLAFLPPGVAESIPLFADERPPLVASPGEVKPASGFHPN